MAIWLFGFLCGATVASFAAAWFMSGAVWLFIAMTFVGILQEDYCRLRVWSLVMAGFLWGAKHNAPAPGEGNQPTFVQVTKTNFLVRAPSQVLVSDGQGTFQLQAQGVGVGRIACRQQGGLFSRHCFLQTPAEDRVEDHLPSWLARRLGNLPAREAAWVEALVFGKKDGLPYSLQKTFKDSGLFHLLVVSGFHLNLIALICSFLIFSPFRLLYALKILPPWVWVYTHLLLRISQNAAVFGFAYLIGFASPCQRAYCIITVSSIPGISGSWRSKLVLAAVMQASLFPVGFFSSSNILSWGTYILIISTLKPVPGWWQLVRRIFDRQLRIFIFCWAVLGQATLAAPFANILLAPLFPLVFFAACLAPWVEPTSMIHRVIVVPQSWFVKATSMLTGYTEYWLGQPLATSGFLQRWLLIPLAYALVSGSIAHLATKAEFANDGSGKDC